MKNKNNINDEFIYVRVIVYPSQYFILINCGTSYVYIAKLFKN